MFRIGIDDTDSPAGMCTTYLAAVLIRRFHRAGVRVIEARLVRLNPNVPEKTRGNAAICLVAEGSLHTAFHLACRAVEELAEMSHEGTHPGVAACGQVPPPDFYLRAVRGFCTLDEAISLLGEWGALFKGYKAGRGLIGATAAICSHFDDFTYELLLYRKRARFGTPREVDRQSLFAADAITYPHTWDTSTGRTTSWSASPTRRTRSSSGYGASAPAGSPWPGRTWCRKDRRASSSLSRTRGRTPTSCQGRSGASRRVTPTSWEGSCIHGRGQSAGATSASPSPTGR